jgi:signal transduction histidine kinase
MKVRFEEEGVNLELDLDESAGEVELDKTRFYRAITNLLENALDAAASKAGAVCLRTKRRDEKVFIEVEDNGEGIQPEDLKKIFDPFFSTKKGSRGTGFGLANVKKIIEEHGGNIRVDSRLHQGSLFCIELPQGN